MTEKTRNGTRPWRAGGDFGAALLEWYEAHGRKDLPWQRDPDPYRIWVSEIMLQQTRVRTVAPYYERFVARFPDAAALAAAPLDEVLRLWSGLGYYARARNLHRAARIVAAQHGGALPATPEGLQALPGVGRSTAAAILALARGAPHAILDGNVKRVLARYHLIDGWPGAAAVERRLWALAEGHLPADEARRYTQAIMDLGATVCTRSRPACHACPLAEGCGARGAERTAEYPRPRPHRALPERQTTMLILRDADGAVLLERRPPAGIWGGLWGPPECPHDPAERGAIRAWCREHLGCRVRAVTAGPAVRHAFTHFRLVIRPLYAAARAVAAVQDAGRVWYNGRRSAAPGMAAPVRRLLAGLVEDGEER